MQNKQERRRAEGCSTSTSRNTVWSTTFDLVIDSIGGGAKTESGDKEAEEAPSASPPALTVVRVKLAARERANAGLRLRISAGWYEALRAAEARGGL